MSYSQSLYRVTVLFLLAAIVFAMTSVSAPRDEITTVLFVGITIVAAIVMLLVTPVALLMIFATFVERAISKDRK